MQPPPNDWFSYPGVTAEAAIGVTLPTSIMPRADEVIKI
jgi:hypothetical protein